MPRKAVKIISKHTFFLERGQRRWCEK